MSRWKAWARLAVIASCVGFAFLNSGAAHAQDTSMVEKIVAMNKSALEDYGTQDYDSAKETLLAALVAGKRAGLDTHPVMARTYVHLGAVYITGLKDRKKGLQAFARALEIDPTIKLAKSMSTPELEAALVEAGKQAQPKPGAVAAAAPPAETPPAPPPPAETPPPAKAPPAKTPPKKRGFVLESDAPSPAPPPPVPRAPRPATTSSSDDDTGEPDVPLHVTALDCPTPDEAPPDKPVRLRCAVAANLSVAKVVLLYRIPGSEDFGEVEMSRTPKGWYEGKVPKKAVTGKSLQFYFEGRNAAGKALVSNGRSDSPNLIVLRERKAAEEAEAEAAEENGGVPAADTEENPLDERDEAAGPRLFLGKVDKSRIGLDTRYGNRRFWIGLGLGSGYGYAKGNGLEVRKDLQQYYSPGAGWAGIGHLAPEIGFQITPDVAISIEGRNQYIPQPAKYSKFTASGAQSVLARLLLFSKQSRLRFYGSLMAGGGEGFRFIVTPDSKLSDLKDTVRGGPYLAGAGFGIYYEISHSLSFITELNALAGFPIFSVVGDVNVGLQVNIY
ncbi:MAG TPA: tetratricopeptide repeat protein [Polyangia bacterium]|nr:tetratricopeptide repeat protein [Polyangia bacterium]